MRTPWTAIEVLFAQILLLIILPAAVVFGYSWGYGHHSYGLFVLNYFSESWMTSRLKEDPCQLAWVVRVESNDDWYLNSERITPVDLSTRLRLRMGERNGCMLLFDANPDVSFADAIHAIELIEQTGGRVALLTPHTKKSHIP
jgi:hypothetical protein